MLQRCDRQPVQFLQVLQLHFSVPGFPSAFRILDLQAVEPSLIHDGLGQFPEFRLHLQDVSLQPAHRGDVDRHRQGSQLDAAVILLRVQPVQDTQILDPVQAFQPQSGDLGFAEVRQCIHTGQVQPAQLLLLQRAPVCQPRTAHNHQLGAVAIRKGSLQAVQ